MIAVVLLLTCFVLPQCCSPALCLLGRLTVRGRVPAAAGLRGVPSGELASSPVQLAFLQLAEPAFDGTAGRAALGPGSRLGSAQLRLELVPGHRRVKRRPRRCGWRERRLGCRARSEVVVRRGVADSGQAGAYLLGEGGDNAALELLVGRGGAELVGVGGGFELVAANGLDVRWSL